LTIVNIGTDTVAFLLEGSEIYELPLAEDDRDRQWLQRKAQQAFSCAGMDGSGELDVDAYRNGSKLLVFATRTHSCSHILYFFQQPEDLLDAGAAMHCDLNATLCFDGAQYYIELPETAEPGILPEYAQRLAVDNQTYEQLKQRSRVILRGAIFAKMKNGR